MTFQSCFQLLLMIFGTIVIIRSSKFSIAPCQLHLKALSNEKRILGIKLRGIRTKTSFFEKILGIKNGENATFRVNKWNELKASTANIYSNLTLTAKLDEKGDVQFIISGNEKPTRSISPELTLSSNSQGPKVSGGIQFKDNHFRGMAETMEIIVSQKDEDDNLLFSSVPNVQVKWSSSSIGKPSLLSLGFDQFRDNHRTKQLFVNEMFSTSALSSPNFDFKKINSLSRKLYATISKTFKKHLFCWEPYLASEVLDTGSGINSDQFYTKQKGIKFIHEFSHDNRNNDKYKLQWLYDLGLRTTSKYQNEKIYNQIQINVDDYDNENSLIIRLGRPFVPITFKLTNAIMAATDTVTKPLFTTMSKMATLTFFPPKNSSEINVINKAEILDPSTSRIAKSSEIKTELITHNQNKFKIAWGEGCQEQTDYSHMSSERIIRRPDDVATLNIPAYVAYKTDIGWINPNSQLIPGVFLDMAQCYDHTGGSEKNKNKNKKVSHIQKYPFYNSFTFLAGAGASIRFKGIRIEFAWPLATLFHSIDPLQFLRSSSNSDSEKSSTLYHKNHRHSRDTATTTTINNPWTPKIYFGLDNGFN